MRAGLRLTAIFVGLASLALAAGPEFERALKLYDSTSYEQSLRLLSAMPEKDGAAYALIGRCYYMNGDFKRATDALERAVAADPRSSTFALWLGRAYGRRAETSSFVSAPGLASKARQYFEKAVELDSRNLEAMSDLFEYYLSAPGFLGGGVDKARTLAERISSIDAAQGHMVQAELAEKAKDYSSAEGHLQRAVASAPGEPGRLIDLASFMMRRGRYQDAERNFAKAVKMAPDSPQVLFGRAEAYVKAKQNPEIAKDLLTRYLALPLTADDPPRSEAQKLLKQVRGS